MKIPVNFLLVCVFSVVGASHCRAQRAPTVVVNIGNSSQSGIDELKAKTNVVWSAEFGDELLLGVSEKTLNAWLQRSDTRPGIGVIAREEILVRDHICHAEARVAPLGVVGGYELLRQPPTLVRYADLQPNSGRAVPSDGIVSKRVNTLTGRKKRIAPDADIQSIVNRIDGARWLQDVASLSGFSRNSENPELVQAHDWILAQFSNAGLQTQSFAYTLGAGSFCSNQTPTTLRNPIGIKPGITRPDEWIVIGAHYDSRNSSSCQSTSVPAQPGANDNASGCSGVIELARAFRDVNTERTILFMCFSGEEQGLLGSSRYVLSLRGSGELSKIKHMINLDMIGHDPNLNQTARIETIPQWQAVWYPYYAGMAATYSPSLNLIQATSTSSYSDHWPFINAAVNGQLIIPGMFTWENGAGIYPQYHTSEDRIGAMINAAGLASSILKMDAAVLADQAILERLFKDGFEPRSGN